MTDGGGRSGFEAMGSHDPALDAAGISPAHMIAGYHAGLFPMDSEDDVGPVGWYFTDPRAVIVTADARIPRTVARMLRRRAYDVRVDTAFGEVLRACSGDRDGVWLTPRLIGGYEALHDLGIAHSIEAWDGDVLAGGLFGIAIDGLMTAESMFHRLPDGGNAAIAGLIGIARINGFTLIDVQMESPHVMRFGATLISADAYTELLADALRR
ncbi:MAG: leucyl/phenylalanyl-tRNA--protein transferase [Actinomycetota bacterium]|nr:leucyl/phenylalanyl-tRNA--protein transferase [Actinomycetota bacterium]